MDQLVGLSDDLAKLDTYVESVTRKMSNYLGDVLEDQRDKLAENLLANQSVWNLYFYLIFILIIFLMTNRSNWRSERKSGFATI